MSDLLRVMRPRTSGWWQRAACLGKFSRVEGEDLFFDYGRSALKVRAAKRVCASCPVRLECLAANITTPRGIFGGYTESERMAMLLGSRRRPRLREAIAWFDNLTGRRAQP